ncbi:MAG: hypothetical protein L0K65_03790, partial [Actinomyces sp.]|nr:hypothetical protein [Actinomyces sp.]
PQTPAPGDEDGEGEPGEATSGQPADGSSDAAAPGRTGGSWSSLVSGWMHREKGDDDAQKS